MNISAPFVHRPIATSLLMLLLALFGAAGYALMPLAALPQVELPTIGVSAELPGASAEVMATSVATPLERQLALISGVSEMTSTSSLGSTSITVQFDLSRNIDGAAQDVQAAINAAAGLLPRTLPSPPSYEKANPADFQIMSISVTSDLLPLSQVNVYADSYIAQQLSRVKGVGLVDLHGEQKPAIRVQLDPGKLALLGLSLEQVRAALGTATANSPKGTLDGPKRSVTVDANDQLNTAPDYDNVVLAYRSGAAIHVRDVGRAVSGVQDVKQAAWIQGKRAIIVDIHKQPGSNVVDTVDEIRRLLPDLERSIPAAVTTQVVNDRTQTIRASLRDVQRTLLLTVGLVVLVVYLFLRGVWATLIPATAIPLSIAGTFGVMGVLGYSIDNLSLMAITIAVGFVVDDAIVVIENIMRHVESGESAMQASLKGVREVSFTVVSMTVSLIAALIPLLLMSGIVGRLFREFSLTVSVALVVSAIVSLTVTPMMCRVLLPLDERRQSRASTSRVSFERLAVTYERALTRVLNHPAITLAITLTVLATTVVMFWAVPKGFFPQQDTGQIIGASEAPTDISAPAMSARQLELVKIVSADPDVANVYSWISPTPAMSNGRLVINLKPFDQRSANATQIMSRLRHKVAGVPGIELHLRTRQELQIGGRSSQTQFQYALEDTDVRQLYAWTPRLIDSLKSLPQLSDVTSDVQAAAPRTTVVIDRERAAQFGITPQAVDDTLYDALGQRQVATIFTQVDQYHVVMELDPAHRLDAEALQQIRVTSAAGQQVPLAAIAHFEDSAVPLQINHQGQFPSVTLSFNLAQGAALGDAVAAVSQRLTTMTLPPTMHGSFQGNAKAFQASESTQPYLILAAILSVYIVLGILYESYVHPLTILSTLPSAGLGALLALSLLHYELNVISMIGIILLIGIVKKNAIMMIDVALHAERTLKISAAQAIKLACRMRFRPIMMTTGAALFGALPLALGSGAGSELRAPVGVALVGGLLVSQLLTLFTTPVIYLYLDRLSQRLTRNRDLKPIEATPSR